MNNQRLECLGDTIVNAIVTKTLYSSHPDWDEGKLSQAKARLISAESLAPVADLLGLKLSGFAHETESTRCDLVEAYIGAIFLDAGFDAAETELLSVMKGRIEHCHPYDGNWKALLQMYAQKLRYELEYQLMSETGNDHNKLFTIRACLRVPDGLKLYPEAKGRSKKAAEVEAARLAINAINQRS
jgi:ribonuclease-3